MEDDSKFDPFFALDGDTEWNAYVGLQGEEHSYVAGYMEAARELVAGVIDRKMIRSRDSLVMPILYNARHGVELALKSALRRLRAIGVGLEGAGHDHDIVGLWRKLDPKKLGDEILVGIISEIGPFVLSLGQVDEDGQEFRYPYRRDGAKSLEEHKLANLQRIRVSLDALQEQLELLDLRVDEIEDERRAGAFTDQCSRRDLVEIAKMLPARSDWNKPDFDTAKAALKARFGLGSDGFSRALKVIETTRELALLIGIESELVHLSDEKVIAVLEVWSGRHPPRKVDPVRPEGIAGIISGRELTARALLRDLAAEEAANKAALAMLSPDELADLEAVYYLGRNRSFGDHYEGDLTRIKREHKVAAEPYAKIDHLMSKTNLASMVAEGVERAGRLSLGHRIRDWRPDLWR